MANNNDKALQEEINSLRQKEVDITNQLTSLRTTLASITEKDAANLEKIRNLTQKILELEGRSSDIATEIVDINGKILRTQEEIVDTMEEQSDTSDDLLDNDKTRLLLSERQKKIYIQIEGIYDSSVDYSRKLLRNQNLTEGGASRIKDILESSSAEQRAFNNLLQTDASNRDDILEAMRSSADVNSEMVSLEESMLSAQEAASKGRLELIDISKSENLLKEINNQLSSEGIQLSNEARDILEKKAELLQSSIDLAKKQNDISKESVKTYEASNDLLSGVFDKMSSSISKIPGGSFLMKHFGFDKMKANIMNNMGGALKTVTDGFSKGGLVGGIKSLAPAAKSFGMALMAGPQVAIFAIAAAVGALIALFMGADKEISEMGKNLGISKKEARAVHEAAVDLAAEMNVIGINAEQIGKSIKTVGENLGGIDVSSRFAAGDKQIQEMVKNASLLTEKFGLSGEEVGNLQGLSAITGQSVGELSMQANILGEGIFNAKENMKILASIPKTVAAGMKGNVSAMIKMAQQAKLIGMDLKKVEQIGRGTLDIEESLAAEMEARVLTGKNINLDAMREAALRNDTGAVMEELVKNAGNLEEFSEMNIVQQEALAKAMGMSRDEMTDMLTKQKELEDAGLSYEEVQDLQKLNAEQLADEIANTTDEGKRAYLEKMQAENESASLQEKMGDMMQKLQSLAVKIVSPILDMVEGLQSGEEASGGFLSIASDIFSILGQIVRGPLIAIKGIWNVISAILDPIFSKLGEIFGSTEEGASGFDGIVKILKVFYDVGEKIWQLLEPFASFIGNTIANAIGFIFDRFSAVYDIISGVVMLFNGDIMGGLEKIGGGVLDFVLAPFELVMNQVEAIGDLAGGLIDNVSSWFGGDDETEEATQETKNAGSSDSSKKSKSPAVEELNEIAGKKAGATELPTGEMPQAADGGKIKSGGLVLVGEKGPELVQLPTAATVASTTAVDQVGSLLNSLGLGSSATGNKKIDATGMASEITGILSSISSLFGMGEESEVAGEESKSIFQQLIDINTLMSEALVSIKDIMTDLVILTEEYTGMYFTDESGGYKYGSELEETVEGSVTPLNESNQFGITTNELFGQEGGLMSSTPVEMSGLVRGEGQGNSMSKVEQKLDTLISLFTQAATQPTVIKFGDKTIEEIKNQLNIIKSRNIGVDNTYGRTI